jgi:hypothetical protein
VGGKTSNTSNYTSGGARARSRPPMRSGPGGARAGFRRPIIVITLLLTDGSRSYTTTGSARTRREGGVRAFLGRRKNNNKIINIEQRLATENVRNRKIYAYA